MKKASMVLGEVVGDWIGSPPVIYHKLHKAMQDPDVSFGDFSDIISADPNLAARLLKIANSPFYGLDAKVKTITHALGIVGIDQVPTKTPAPRKWCAVAARPWTPIVWI